MDCEGLELRPVVMMAQEGGLLERFELPWHNQTQLLRTRLDPLLLLKR